MGWGGGGREEKEGTGEQEGMVRNRGWGWGMGSEVFDGAIPKHGKGGWGGGGGQAACSSIAAQDENACVGPHAQPSPSPPALMPPKGETHAQKAERLDRKALELRHRDKRLAVQALMLKQPDAVPKIVDYLMSIGLWQGNGQPLAIEGDSGKEVLSTPVKAKPAAKACAGKGHEEETAKDDMGSQKVPMQIHKNFSKMENMPLVHLRAWLTAMEPVALSEAQLKVLVKRGSCDASRHSLTELLEYTTNLDPSAPLFAEGRDEETLSKFTEQLLQLNASMGRRARDLQLPANWSRDGFYHVKVIDGKAFLWHRLKDTYAPPTGFLEQPANLQGVTVELNFSENRACIKTGSGPFDTMLCRAVMDGAPRAIDGQPPCKKGRRSPDQQLALTAGPWGQQDGAEAQEAAGDGVATEASTTATANASGSSSSSLPLGLGSEQPSVHVASASTGGDENSFDELRFIPPGDME